MGRMTLLMHVYSSGESRTPALGAIALLAVVVSMAANAAGDAMGVGPAWLVSAPTVAAAFGLLYRLVDTAAWRWPLLRHLGIIQTPVVQGVYEGNLTSTFAGVSLPIKLTIDQTWSKIIIRLDVTEPKSSSSTSTTADLGVIGPERVRLSYTYHSRIRPGTADSDLHDHDGAAEVILECATGAISGRYFNFRGRQGTLTLQKCHVTTAGDGSASP